MNVREASEAARRRIRAFLRETPIEWSPELSSLTGGDVWLKLECLQLTGSFKLRGALSKLLALTPDARSRGVVTASTGNHGAAVAQGSAMFHVACEVFVPEHAAPSKVAAIRRLGAEVRVAGAVCDAAEAFARAEAERSGRTFISPYNDPDVVAGQGTLGLEIIDQLGFAPDDTFVALGSGGLAAGVAGALKGASPTARMVGCSPENDCAMAESLRAGRIVRMDARPTLSDGTAGGIEPGSITFELCRELIDEVELLPEEEIRAALRWTIDAHHVLIEGSAAVPVAAVRRAATRLAGRRVVIVLCGANIGADTLAQVLAN